jgi:hypothetical protein
LFPLGGYALSQPREAELRTNIVRKLKGLQNANIVVWWVLAGVFRAAPRDLLLAALLTAPLDACLVGPDFKSPSAPVAESAGGRTEAAR